MAFHGDTKEDCCEEKKDENQKRNTENLNRHVDDSLQLDIYKSSDCSMIYCRMLVIKCILYETPTDCHRRLCCCFFNPKSLTITTFILTL
jgi:hypothetical protein